MGRYKNPRENWADCTACGEFKRINMLDGLPYCRWCWKDEYEKKKRARREKKKLGRPKKDGCRIVPE